MVLPGKYYFPRLSLVVHTLDCPIGAPRVESKFPLSLRIRVRREKLARMVTISGHRGPGSLARGGKQGRGDHRRHWIVLAAPGFGQRLRSSLGHADRQLIGL